MKLSHGTRGTKHFLYGTITIDPELFKLSVEKVGINGCLLLIFNMN